MEQIDANKSIESVTSSHFLGYDHPEGIAIYRRKGWDSNSSYDAELRTTLHEPTGYVIRELLVDPAKYHKVRCSLCWSGLGWGSIARHDCRDKNDFIVFTSRATVIVPKTADVRKNSHVDPGQKSKKLDEIRCTELAGRATTRSQTFHAKSDDGSGDMPSPPSPQSDSEFSIETVASNSSWQNLPSELRTLSPKDSINFDSIQYYIPGGTGGLERDRRVGTIYSVVKDKYPLVLSTGDFLEKDHHVSKYSFNGKKHYWGTYASIKKFKLVRGGKYTHFDVIMDQAGSFSSIMSDHRQRLRERATREGYAPMDAVKVLKGGRKFVSK